MRRPLALLFVFSFIGISARADTALVLPFSNLSKSGNLDWVGESFSESIRESLAAEGVLVLDRNARAEGYRRLSLRPNAVLTRASAVKLAESLDAPLVVFGRFEAGEPVAGKPTPLRVVASVIDSRHLRSSPQFEEIGALEDLTDIQARTAWKVLKYLQPKAAPSEEEFRRRQPRVRLDAVESYIRGLLSPVPEQKHRYFTQAARLEPQYSQPCFELGRLQWESENYRVAAGWLEKVGESSANYHHATFLLGLSRFYMGDYTGAQKAFEQVYDSVPLNEVMNNLGAALSRQDKPGALERFLKALEEDPADPDYHFNAGYLHWKQGRFAEAIESLQAVLDRDPEDEQAIALLDRSRKQSGPRPGELNSEPLERLKFEYPETAYRQLKELLRPTEARGLAASRP